VPAAVDGASGSTVAFQVDVAGTSASAP
ncbi:uncharacterized protein METZ01_LOCUS464881, partial [marine metagenome]